MTEIIVRRLTENDISTAERIYRLAFGNFVGLHDPIQFSGDADPIRTRFRADPSAALAAEMNGELVDKRYYINVNHILVRDILHALSVIPARYEHVPIRNTHGKYRKLMKWVFQIVVQSTKQGRNHHLGDK